MNESRPYRLPEEETNRVSEPQDVRVYQSADIRRLRHDVMDAVYETNDQEALYSCLKLLVGVKQRKDSPVKAQWMKRLDELSRLKDGWDGEGSKRISRSILAFVKRVIGEATDDDLADWVLFPDARGYLYLDYTHGPDIAGITIADNQMSAFVKRVGQVKKAVYTTLEECDVITILKESHE